MGTSRVNSATEIVLPYEIRKLICNAVDKAGDLNSLKSLRLVSTSWALTSFEFLLRGTFVIHSDSDVDRLQNVTTNSRWSHLASRLITTIQIESSYSSFSSIRHKVLEYSPNSTTIRRFSHTDQQDMLRELDDGNNKLNCIHWDGLNRLDVLISAFQRLPRINTIDFAVPNPFKHTILRRLWRETSFVDYQTQPTRVWTTHLKNVLSAVKEAKLNLQNFTYTQLPSMLFTSPDEQLRKEVLRHLTSIKSLSLTINDSHNKPGSRSISRRDAASDMLKQLASSLPHLESLFIQFTFVEKVPIDFWPVAMEGRLHSLCLVEIGFECDELLAFLDLHRIALRRLSLGSICIRDFQLTSRGFVEALQGHFQDFSLEKFELCGMIRSCVPRDDAWCIPSIYTKDWDDVVLEEGAAPNLKTKLLEDFVLRSGPWPMTIEDDVSYFGRFQ